MAPGAAASGELTPSGTVVALHGAGLLGLATARELADLARYLCGVKTREQHAALLRPKGKVVLHSWSVAPELQCVISCCDFVRSPGDGYQDGGFLLPTGFAARVVHAINSRRPQPCAGSLDSGDVEALACIGVVPREVVVVRALDTFEKARRYEQVVGPSVLYGIYADSPLCDEYGYCDREDFDDLWCGTVYHHHLVVELMQTEGHLLACVSLDSCIDVLHRPAVKRACALVRTPRAFVELRRRGFVEAAEARGCRVASSGELTQEDVQALGGLSDAEKAHLALAGFCVPALEPSTKRARLDVDVAK